MNRRLFSICAILGVMSILSVQAQAAATLSLTTAGDSGTINDAIFQHIDLSSTGTGVIDPFVRLNNNLAIEQGYNSDSRPFQFDEDTYSKALPLGAIPVVEIGGTLYREFLLDINQNKSTEGRFISLDELEVYQSDLADLDGYPTGWGTPLYDLDEGADNWILLDYSLNSGSGAGDMFAYIPNEDFDGSKQYVYLYSLFGDNNANTAGFEEWAVRIGDDVPPPPPPPPVPAPGAVLLAGLGAGAVGYLRRRRAL